MTLVDSHCHLDDEQFDADRELVIARALEAGVSRLLAVGAGNGPPDLEAGIRLAETHPAIDATVGIHPHDAAKADEAAVARLRELMKHPKVVAVGEIGLDYHYDFSPRETQRAVFIEQMRLAREAARPIVVHTREAWDDTLSLLAAHWQPAGIPGIMHCFSGGPAEAARCVEMGFYLSFGGIVTFPKAHKNREAVRAVPADRLLVETDSPYLAPVPLRGKRNEPAFMVHTARKVAELRGVSLEDLAAATTRNYLRLMFATSGGQRIN